MFDNPKKALARLQEELMAVEHRNEEPEEPAEAEESAEDVLKEMESFLEGQEWEEEEREPLASRYAPEKETAADFEFAEAEPEERPKMKKKTKKKVDPLVIALIEMIGVSVLIGGWLLWNK